MPFKLKLKKTRQYNVASKSLFVISVELLDGGVADCTLSVDSTGQECLDNVCQRQAINQPDFFGLRYINRTHQPRWVQSDRPLKRQLEKHASSHQLYLRVMYYVTSGTSLITDEMTRYHYFLQLKNDLIEGRIICDCQQAVVLASYSRQAEYGNHDRERHTVDYLKNLLTFPKQMLDGGQLIDGTTLAETGRLEYLISTVIQHHMALHNMSQAQAEEGFITTCQQLRGYGQEMFTARDQNNQSEVTIAVSLTGIRVLFENSDTPYFYRWMDITNVINHKRTFSIECQKQSESASFTLPTPEDGKYVWRMCVQQHTFYMRHQSALTDSQSHHHPTVNFQEHGLSESREELDSREIGSISRLEPLTPSHRAHSTSCLELAEHQPQPHPRNRAQLPSYRPAPDYETAIQQKYQQQRAEAQLRYHTHHHTQFVANKPPLIYGSHPDIHRVHYPDVTRHTVSVNQGVTQDDYAYGVKFLSPNYPFAVNPNVQTDLNTQLQYVNVYKPPPPYPSNGLASNSTPDLAVASQALNYHRGYINSHVSGSSPDLVSTRAALNHQYLGYHNHSILNYGRPNVVPAPHGNYNNLPPVLDPNPHIIIDPHHISDNIQKVYDERGNIMYSMPHRIGYQHHVVLPQQMKLGETEEPIYENVPLPWKSDDRTTPRDRAQSLTTTDEIRRLNERNGNGTNPVVHRHCNVNANLNPPSYCIPKIETPDSHYVNAHVIKGVREASVPNNDLNLSCRSLQKKEELDRITTSMDRISLKQEEKDYDETPYQSLSTHRVSGNKCSENVTSISVPDVRSRLTDQDLPRGSTCPADTVLSTSVVNSTYSSSVELETSGNVTKNSSVSSKEKKRRRWGMFMGRGTKNTDVKSATLGRDKAKANQTQQAKHRWSTEDWPKFHPLPPSITKENLCQLLELRMSDEQLSFAFEQIPKGREVGGEVRTALLPQHASLNNYSTDHLPYEDNRVKLHPTALNPHGYINASHITMTVGNMQRFYVVAKVPDCCIEPKLSSPVSGLDANALIWECVWQVGARLVARVGGPLSPGYLPQDNTTKDFGKFQVRAERSTAAPWGATLRLRLMGGGRSARTVWHLHYRSWTHDNTDLHNTLDFLSELNALRVACESEASVRSDPLGARNAPVVFTCAEGAGRSGTMLAADLLLHILDNNQELDIPRTISMLHQQRSNLIQNLHQYKFIHQILLDYLKQSRLI